MPDPDVNPNQKLRIPRFAPAQGFSFRRSKFLDGSFIVGWGPGQDYVPEFDYNYYPPTDWPRAGMLLRVPQVVWLGIRLNNDRSIIPDPELGSLGDTPSPYIAVTEAIVAVFLGVQARVNPLRAGKTWVSVIDYNNITDMYGTGGRGGPPTGSQFGAAINTVPVLGADFPELGVHDDLYGGPFSDFFGTNFLNIICYDTFIENRVGDGGAYPGGPDHLYYAGPPSLPDLVGFPYHGSGATELDDIWLLNAAGRVIPWRNSVAKFAHYRGVAYAPAGDYQATDDGQTWTNDSTRQFVSDICADFQSRGYDFTYAGTTDDVDADSLVNLIADHFGFDPVTGKDL